TGACGRGSLFGPRRAGAAAPLAAAAMAAGWLVWSSLCGGPGGRVCLALAGRPLPWPWPPPQWRLAPARGRAGAGVCLALAGRALPRPWPPPQWRLAPAILDGWCSSMGTA
ncbi:MAG: hypothetical protein CMO30_09360, partial [Tistrella sp.]|nr:hypothetical protein [Tistrella sp.]